MPATRYKVYHWGNRVTDVAGNPLGVTGAIRVAMTSVAKKATATEPYIIANEVICSSLARMLLLPCPPGATLDRGGEPYFFSLDFNLAGDSLPPADPVALVTAHPRMAWGIILFDCLVLNHDRHPGNIAYDTSTQKVQIFDHSHAFLRTRGDITAWLQACDGQLCIGGHCLAPVIATDDGMDIWAGRINSIPDYFIEGVIEAAGTVGLPENHKAECVAFLKKRRSEIRQIVQNNMAAFPQVP